MSGNDSSPEYQQANDGEASVIDAAVSAPTRAEIAAFNRSATPSQGHVTQTWFQQRDVEQRVFLLNRANPSYPPQLRRELHLQFLTKGLKGVGARYSGLHSSQPWLLYWMLHAMDVMGERPSPGLADMAVRHIVLCRDDLTGGFGGGPGQSAHLASTYAAVAALVVLGTREAFEAIRPEALKKFLRKMKCDDGGFLISETGEKDVRALYSAMAVASMAGIIDADLTSNVGKYVRGLVSFDGGLGGEPGTEAHGGNTYCGIAGAALAKSLSSIDCEAVIDWAAMRQCRLEGGFCGRTNKLVDSCYSFWVGALFPILGASSVFNADALQRYILVCCQDEKGGLRDKPGVGADYHHTCYALSGLSIAQHYGGATVEDETTKVRKIDVLHNVCEERMEALRAFFNKESTI